MDSLLVWVVIFAGAALSLLGVFLVASERELKVKRRELEELLARLKNAPHENSRGQAAAVQSDTSAELAELLQQNQELQNQLNTLSGKLELGRRTIDEFEATQGDADNERAENQQLRAANDQLKAETNELRNRLQANEARVIGATDDQAAATRDNRLQNEIADLQRKLEESQVKLREFDSLQQKVVKADAFEASHREDRQTLQSRIADLERELSNGQEKVRELESLKDRLAESERNQEALREESRRHDEEIVRWRERIAEGDENRRRLASLQAPYNELISKQTALAEQQREFQEELAGFARMIAILPRENASMTSTSSSPSHASEPSTGARDDTESPSSAQPRGAATASPEQKTTRRYGIFFAVIVLAAAALFAVQYLNPNTGKSTTPAAVASPPRVTESTTPATHLSSVNTQPIAIEPPTVPTKTIAKEITKPAATKSSRNIVATAKQEPRPTSTYEITQPSRVYAAPTELSQPIGKIEPGVRVNVVNNRDGWLEIHSKHGRPPGFIRREMAAVVTGRN